MRKRSWFLIAVQLKVLFQRTSEEMCLSCKLWEGALAEQTASSLNYWSVFDKSWVFWKWGIKQSRGASPVAWLAQKEEAALNMKQRAARTSGCPSVNWSVLWWQQAAGKDRLILGEGPALHSGELFRAQLNRHWHWLTLPLPLSVHFMALSSISVLFFPFGEWLKWQHLCPVGSVLWRWCTLVTHKIFSDSHPSNGWDKAVPFSEFFTLWSFSVMIFLNFDDIWYVNLIYNQLQLL